MSKPGWTTKAFESLVSFDINYDGDVAVQGFVGTGGDVTVLGNVPFRIPAGT